MSYGKANNILKKSLLFKLAHNNSNYLWCFRCNKQIETVNDFSVEHKIAWLDSPDPINLFFDLQNITFSHLSCNVKYIRRKVGKHPSKRKYQLGCRCDGCKKAQSLSMKKYRDKKSLASPNE